MHIYIYIQYIQAKSTYTIHYLSDWHHEHTHSHTQNDQTKWSLLRPISDLTASCGLQGPGPRAGLDPQHDPDDPDERSRQGEGWRERTLCGTDHPVRRHFRTEPPFTQMSTSLPELSEPVHALLAGTRMTTNAQTTPDPELRTRRPRL